MPQLDLAVRISGVGRYRGRQLHDGGFQTVMDIYESAPEKIQDRTNLRLGSIKKIYEACIRIKEANKQLI